MKKIVKQYGMMWIPAATANGVSILEDRVTPPRINPTLRIQLAIGDIAIQASYKGRPTIQLNSISFKNAQIAALDDQIAQFKESLSTRQGRLYFYRLAAELCVRDYNKWMWSILQERWIEHIPASQVSPKARTVKLDSTDFRNWLSSCGWSTDILNGLVAQGFGQITQVFKTLVELKITEAAFTERLAKRFPKHASGLWVDRVRYLFLPVDKGQFSKSKAPFIQTAQQLYELLHDRFTTLGFKNEFDSEWEKYFVQYIAYSTFAILQYNYNDPAALSSNKVQGSLGKPTIDYTMTALQRTAFFTPVFTRNQIRRYTREFNSSLLPIARDPGNTVHFNLETEAYSAYIKDALRKSQAQMRL